MGLQLAHNKVSAGHLRKLRDAKNIMKKSASDMAAIFGVKADAYSSDPPTLTPLCINLKRRTTLPVGVDNGGSISKRKKRKRDTRGTKKTAQ